MTANTLKDKLHILIDQVQDETVLEAYSTLLEKELERENNSANTWNDLPDEIKLNLQESLEDSNNNISGRNAINYLSQLKK